MPWLDIGDLPHTYNFQRSEPYQQFNMPESRPPNHFFIGYNDWLDAYCLGGLDHGLIYNALRGRIDEFQLNETIERASTIVSDHKGKVSKHARTLNYVFATLGVGILVLAISIGVAYQSWFWGLFVIASYGLACLMIIYYLKGRTAKALRLSHMLLSILLRVENNRVYLRRGVELRPGYLGKWFEVIIHHKKPQEILMLMRRR